MSNIDLSRMITADTKADQAAAERLATRKAECRARILAVVDMTAQLNLAAAAGAGALDAEQMSLYRAGVEWIRQMRAACVAGPWPPVPPGVSELAAQY
jgi:hypothetical protein